MYNDFLNVMVTIMEPKEKCIYYTANINLQQNTYYYYIINYLVVIVSIIYNIIPAILILYSILTILLYLEQNNVDLL